MFKIQYYDYYDTSHRCKIKKVIEFFRKKSYSMIKKLKYDIFNIMNINHSFEYNILQDFDRKYHNANTNELRNRKYVLTSAQIA